MIHRFTEAELAQHDAQVAATVADDMETLTHLRAKILGVFGDYWCEHCEENMPDGLLTEGDLRAAFGAHLSAVLAARHDADREDGVWFSPSDLVRHDADIAAAKAAGAAEVPLVDLLTAQRDWSIETFGPGDRLAGVLDHIRKELREVEADPTDVTEWIDVVILAFDGAWRAGHEPADIVAALVAKYAKNRARTWPDWRTADPNKAIEHTPADVPRAALTTGGEGA